jgi:serine/threonine protein kinase
VILSDKRNISVGLRDLLVRFLTKDPLKRITIAELRENNWINEGYKTKLNSEEYVLIVVFFHF